MACSSRVVLPQRSYISVGLVFGGQVKDLSLEISCKALRRAIARQKNTGVLQVPNGVDPAELLRATEHYEELCRFYGAIDIEGLVNAATRIVHEERIKLP